MIKDIFHKIQIKNAFGKYMDKKIIENILQKENFGIDTPEEKKCGYIIFDIMQNEYFENTLTELIEYLKNKDFISDIYGTIVVCFLCRAKWNQNIDLDIEKSLNKFIENIPENIMKSIRCIYGIENAKVGFFGSSNKCTYMVLLNNYFNKILEISKIKYGEIIELK